ncbi:protein-methionine-sulfoxide reductase catalytic subunit MsrP [Prosthecomicrobium pneumaticum]|nr:protein-methionine-sulfoxide reductase catalytic subunit MsrP [Prosthecomicrobium pneumaticum]
MLIRNKRRWEIAEREATPEAAFLDRRQILAAAGLGAVGLGAAALPLGVTGRAAAQEADPTADLYPAKRNGKFTLDRGLTPEEINAHYNNFYEFSTDKELADAAQRLRTRPWQVKFDGLVEAEKTVDIDTLIRAMPLEERLYRHRCVEAWSMTVPWTGFPLAALVAYAKPLAAAKYVRMETFLDADMAPGQNQPWYPWPYIEGLTMAEATNDLAFMVTGAYGKPVMKQMGAPLRLATPWKYGFKSIKSIVRFSFVEERPVGLWEALQSSEYGFWANVNPEVPHPRWSQAEERVLHTGERVPTLLFNGYAEEVAGLYKGLENEPLYM